MELIHGGDREGYRGRYGREPVDFSANISPLGMPEGVKIAAVEALARAECYPDPLCRRLRKALGQGAGMEPDHIICGNGAADLVYRLMLAVRPRQVLVTAPSFAEYEQAARLAGSRVVYQDLSAERNFRLDESIVEKIGQDTDIVFLCEPNNPTGVCTPMALLERILERCSSCGCFLAVDECFLDFVERPRERSMERFLDSYKNLILFRAFTKIYAMAGIRLGYCLCSDRELLQKMALAGQPWPVSVVAQEAGIAALKETEYVARVRQLVSREREYLSYGLKELGCFVWPGEANFLLFRSPAGQLGKRMEEKGFLLRSCNNYRLLGDQHYRIAVKTHPENQALLYAMKEVL